jgi:hypothetical protein
MKSPTLLPEEENIRRGVQALIKALGPIEAVRFLTLPRYRRLESVQRHRKWQATLDREEFFNEVFGPRK